MIEKSSELADIRVGQKPRVVEGPFEAGLRSERALKAMIPSVNVAIHGLKKLFRLLWPHLSIERP